MKFKTKLAAERYSLNHPKLTEITIDAAKFCMDNFGYELVVTETGTTMAEDQAVNRVSSTHRDRPVRANDYRTKDMPPQCKEMLKTYLLQKYGHLGAISAKSKKPNLVEDKKHGTEDHFHVQIQRGIPV